MISGDSAGALMARGGWMALAMGLWMVCAAAVAAYPDRPLRFIVPSATGGLPDINARLYAVELGKRLGQQVVVDNRPGASSSIGFELMAKAAADGYTIGYASFPIATNHLFMSRLGYDAQRDFAPVIMGGFSPNVLAISTALPVKSVQELIAYAKANPGTLRYVSTGYGATNFLCVELLKQLAGIDIVHVPYKGVQQGITDIIGGQVHVICDQIGSSYPHVRAGRLRGLAVTGPKRAAAAPELPTVAEAGVPGFEIIAWAGIVVPARTPQPVIMRLNEAFNQVLTSAPVKERFATMNYEGVGGAPEVFAEHLRKEMAKWGGLAKRMGLKPPT
jgi:tripartite-type tricarboxylate transporter receptor subunit TctC